MKKIIFNNSHIKYRPEVDGLRAIAVIPVVLFHLGLSWINGGYLGVDVFFVISGYLISSILLKENQGGTFTYKNFWLRRIRRILPALLVMTIVVLLASYFIVFNGLLSSYAADGAASIFSYANIEILLKFGDYWGQAAEKSPFLHTWSLSVEEQFYLVYPFFIAVLVARKINLYKALSLLILLSFVGFVYTSFAYPKYCFYLLPFRAWELACGGLLALGKEELVRVSSSLHKKIFPSIGFVLIVVSYFFTPDTGGISFMTVLPVFGSVMIIGFSSSEEPIGKFLGGKVPVFIGKISYSLYLWHWPVIVLFKEYKYAMGQDSFAYLGFVVIITTILSLLSYYFVEVPTRKMKRILTLVVCLFTMALAIIFTYHLGLLKKQYESHFDTPKFYGMYYDISPTLGPISEENRQRRIGTFAPERDSTFHNTYNKEGIIRGNSVGFPDLIVMGDSHGCMWDKVIDESGEELGLKRSIYTTSGNNPFFSIPFHQPVKKRKGYTEKQWQEYAESIISHIKIWKPKVLLIACKWSDMKDEDFANLESLISLCSQNATKVLILNQPPMVTRIGDSNAQQILTFLEFRPNGADQFLPMQDNEDVVNHNLKLKALERKYANCMVLNVNANYGKEGKILVIRNRNILYYDDDHLNYEGTLISKAQIKVALKELVSK
jgi:peptidoglycan/LPS O-acetylase OafA/YrhL